jgi:hypothetical protein
VPVYQEIEHRAWSGAPLGDVIKRTHDGVILAAGGRLPPQPDLQDGRPAPRWSGSDVMLQGTASRVLFGDPALIVMDPLTAPPWAVEVLPAGEGALRVRATLQNPLLRSSFTDTYFADLAADPTLYNDCARLDCDLPPGWDSVREVAVLSVPQGLKHALRGFAVEQDGPASRLHVQVDVASSGYMQSALRRAGAVVELEVRR